MVAGMGRHVCVAWGRAPSTLLLPTNRTPLSQCVGSPFSIQAHNGFPDPSRKGDEPSNRPANRESRRKSSSSKPLFKIETSTEEAMRVLRAAMSQESNADAEATGAQTSAELADAGDDERAGDDATIDGPRGSSKQRPQKPQRRASASSIPAADLPSNLQRRKSCSCSKTANWPLIFYHSKITKMIGI